MPIEDIEAPYPRLGLITAGYTTVKKTSKGPVAVPTKSETFVFRSDDRRRLEVVSRVLGGTVQPSPDPRSDVTRFQCITRASELEVIIPADDDRGWTAAYELWGRGGCLRRCTGKTCQFAIDPETGERRENVPCVCKELGLRRKDPNHCRPVSRLNVVVPALAKAPGLGVWQFVSRGYTTFRRIQGALNLARELSPDKSIRGVPLILRIVMNQRLDRATGQRIRFPTVDVVVDESYAEVLRRRLEVRVPVEALPGPDLETPPPGAYLTPEQAEAAEEEEEFLGEELPVEDLPVEELEDVAEAEPEEYPAPEDLTADDEPEPAVEEAKEIPQPAVRRDYTEFWKAVRAAARAEELDPHEWLRRNAGTDDPRRLDDRSLEAALRKARGEKPAVRPRPEARAEAEAARRPIDPGLAARMAEQLRARARTKGITDEQLMELVREAGNGNHADLADAIAEGGYGLFNVVFRKIG